MNIEDVNDELNYYNDMIIKRAVIHTWAARSYNEIVAEAKSFAEEHGVEYTPPSLNIDVKSKEYRDCDWSSSSVDC